MMKLLGSSFSIAMCDVSAESVVSHQIDPSEVWTDIRRSVAAHGRPGWIADQPIVPYAKEIDPGPPPVRGFTACWCCHGMGFMAHGAFGARTFDRCAVCKGLGQAEVERF